MKPDIPSVQIDSAYLCLNTCSNGVFVRRERYGNDCRTTDVLDTAVFRDPAEFGKWCAEWMTKQLAKTPR